MDSPTTPSGSVFISYAHEDIERVEPIVKFLHEKGLSIWLDKHDIEPGTQFREVIRKGLDEAACVVVFWTKESVKSQFVRSEASVGQERGVLLPVRLDAAARIPLGFTELQCADLTHWDNTESEEVRLLVKRIGSLVAHRSSLSGRQGTMTNSDWYFNNTEYYVSGMRNLTSGIRSISHLLVSDGAPINDLVGALREVRNTYNAVNTAIKRFTKPAIGTKSINPAPFLKIEGGALITQIEDGHGHCGQILTHYYRYGGIRDWLEGKLSPQDLQNTDVLFERLGTADGDLFRPLEGIGDILTNESGVIVNLLLAGQEDAARQRIREGRLKLAPLRESLTAAMQEVQELEHSLGYTDSTA